MREREGVLLGLSGGVDSAVAAILLREAGYEVETVTLRLWADDEPLTRAEAIAHHLKLPWHSIDLTARFRQQVIHPFIEAYASGRTPNPCVFCNPEVKLWGLLGEAERTGARWIATGHYARIEQRGANAHLLTARARRRDQSYFLYRLPQSLLRRLRLPLGELNAKATVREVARRYGLEVAELADSQDLCFVAGGDYRAFLRRERPDLFRPGPITDQHGNLLGRHGGLAAYTIGQRRGLGGLSTQRLYVIDRVLEENRLVVGPAEALLRSDAVLESVVFTVAEPPLPAEIQVRVRSQAHPVAATLVREAEQWHLHFAEAQRGLARGQSAVFYREDEVIGGGLFAD